jgi:hypothetical protein
MAGGALRYLALMGLLVAVTAVPHSTKTGHQLVHTHKHKPRRTPVRMAPRGHGTPHQVAEENHEVAHVKQDKTTNANARSKLHHGGTGLVRRPHHPHPAPQSSGLAPVIEDRQLDAAKDTLSKVRLRLKQRKKAHDTAQALDAGLEAFKNGNSVTA